MNNLGRGERGTRLNVNVQLLPLINSTFVLVLLSLHSLDCSSV
jgi:hypothetical protein